MYLINFFLPTTLYLIIFNFFFINDPIMDLATQLVIDAIILSIMFSACDAFNDQSDKGLVEGNYITTSNTRKKSNNGTFLVRTLI